MTFKAEGTMEYAAPSSWAQLRPRHEEGNSEEEVTGGLTPPVYLRTCLPKEKKTLN